jgi:regulator of replication initiation timing
MSDTDKAIISESYINILQHRVEELEAENAKLKLDIKELRETLEDEGVEL